MKRVFAIALFLAATLGATFGDLSAGWSTNFTTALAEAKDQQQPALVYFTASWCGPCKLMARTTLTNAAVIGALTNFHHVAVDIDVHHDLAEKYGVRAVPTFQMLTPAGEAATSTTGYQDAERFLHWLTNGVSEVKAAVLRQKQAEEKLASADLLLGRADVESLRKAAAELMDLGTERDAAVPAAAAARLAVLAKRDPALLLDGLNHPRLAVRIHAANLLRAQLGDTFEVDPWSDAPTRQEAIARWRAALADRKPTGEKNP